MFLHGSRHRKLKRRRLVPRQQMGVAGQREGGRVVAEGSAELEEVGAAPQVQGGEVWRNVWKPAQGAPACLTSGLRTRGRRLLGSSGVPDSFGKRIPVES